MQQWLELFLAYMVQCHVVDNADLCYYITVAVEPDSKAAQFVATQTAAGTLPSQDFGAAIAAHMSILCPSMQQHSHIVVPVHDLAVW